MSKAWPKVRLGEVLTRRMPDTQVSKEGEYQFAGVYCFGRGVFRSHLRQGTEFAYSVLTKIRAGEFIYPKLMAWEGAFGLVPESCDGCYVSPEFPVFEINRDRLEPKFLDWMFKRPRTVEEIAGGSTGTNVRRQRLNPADFLAAEVLLPEISEQRRLVTRIEELKVLADQAIATNTDSSELGNSLKSSCLRSKIQFHHHWRSLSIESACEVMIDYRGRTPPVCDSGIPHITSANIKNGRINWGNSKFVTEAVYSEFMTRGIPQLGDVLFTMEAPLGEAGVVLDDRRFSLAQRLILLRPRHGTIEGRFLALALESPVVRDAIKSKATSTTVAGIASKRLKHILVPVPPLPEQRRIVAELDALQAQVDDLKRHQAETAAELDALLPAILDKAFKGEL